jgi:hypothetical protein
MSQMHLRNADVMYALIPIEARAVPGGGNAVSSKLFFGGDLAAMAMVTPAARAAVFEG